MANDSNRDRQNPNEDEQTRQTGSGQDRDSQAATRKPGGGSEPADDQDDEDTDDMDTPVTENTPSKDRSSR